ncbi:MAG TPA: hypothetical protein VEC06_08120 [Paucimonas sp.]|nr:hypothetical protein [Paucimonas sp.]
MSNIAGKAYAMNVITPLRWYMAWLNKFFFRFVGWFPSYLNGLITLSLIHYARWVVIGRNQFPHVDPAQPKENLKYSYMLFASNFNGSWDQYVDSFTFAIPKGLDLFWTGNIRYPRSVPLTPFHEYIRYNQIETIHYYSAYPLATSNDIKSAKKVKAALIEFADGWADASPDQFQKQYHALLRNLQNDLGDMSPAPIISMAAAQVQKRHLRDLRKASERAAIDKILAVDESRAGSPAASKQKETADE